MDFLIVVFLSSQAGFSTTFLDNCGRGVSLWTTTCLISVFDGRQGHAPCNVV